MWVGVDYSGGKLSKKTKPETVDWDLWLGPAEKRAYVESTINGQPCPLQMTRELAAMLVQIHGQHEQQHLLKRDFQRTLLDAYAGHPKLTDAVATIFQQWQDRTLNWRERWMDFQNNP